jgi:hypothetical protein
MSHAKVKTVNIFMNCKPKYDLSDGMVRPQVADGGTAANMEGSCEQIE